MLDIRVRGGKGRAEKRKAAESVPRLQRTCSQDGGHKDRREAELDSETSGNSSWDLACLAGRLPYTALHPPLQPLPALLFP